MKLSARVVTIDDKVGWGLCILVAERLLQYALAPTPVHYLTSVSLLKASHNTVDTHVLNSSLVLIRVSRQRPHHSGLPTTRHGVPVASWLGHDVQDPQGGRSASRFRSPHPMFTCTHTTHTPHAHVKPFARSLCMKRNHVNPAFGCA
jgi:hypothetical protein